MAKIISLVGVPMDLGQNRRGVDMGPSAIRYSRVKERIESLGICVEDLGDIEVPSINNATNQSKQQNLNNLPEVVLSNKRLAKTVDEIVKKESFPLILGGDHSIAIGSLAGLYPHYNTLGVIWFDDHEDINSNESYPSGIIYGLTFS